MVKSPDDIHQILACFTSANLFAGNTYQLKVDNEKLTAAQAQVIALLKASNSGSGYTNLASKLQFQYQLANSNFMSAEELQAFLQQQTDVDQTSNALKLKLALVQEAAPEFELASELQAELTLLSDNNHIIKKLIHGRRYETALNQPGAIVASGDRAQLQYNFVQELSAFKLATTFPSHLTLAYQLVKNSEASDGLT